MGVDAGNENGVLVDGPIRAGKDKIDGGRGAGGTASDPEFTLPNGVLRVFFCAPLDEERKHGVGVPLVTF